MMLGNINIFSGKCLVFLLLFIIVIYGSYNYAEAEKLESLQIDVETVAENLEIPWAISFAPDGRIFFTERVGNLRVIENGQLNPDPVTSIDVGSGEGGLLGLALDPSFPNAHKQ